MRKLLLSFALTVFFASSSLAIDMQAHVASDAAKEAYITYLTKQQYYYTLFNSIDSLRLLTGEVLFARLNTLMGETNDIARGSYSYNKLRNNYVLVDKDLNNAGKLIGFYDGRSINGTWDSGSTWNREHVWPQSKGVSSGYAMGYDMNSVRPAWTAQNSDRGNTAYGESSSYYDPNDIAINNSDYQSVNLGSYRGDAARIILYCYLNYGKLGSAQNYLFNGAAQLLEKFGTSGVFESLKVLLSWHQLDPPSLTEMLRNDGGQDFQGNRNPFIDYPELAGMIFKGISNTGTTLYTVTYSMAETAAPCHKYVTADGFYTYITDREGNHPTEVTVTGAHSQYDAFLGRLKVTNITGPVTISTDTPMPDPLPDPDPETALDEVLHHAPQATKVIENGQLIIQRGKVKYSILGQRCQ